MKSFFCSLGPECLPWHFLKVHFLPSSPSLSYSPPPPHSPSPPPFPPFLLLPLLLHLLFSSFPILFPPLPSFSASPPPPSCPPSSPHPSPTPSPPPPSSSPHPTPPSSPYSSTSYSPPPSSSSSSSSSFSIGATTLGGFWPALRCCSTIHTVPYFFIFDEFQCLIYFFQYNFYIVVKVLHICVTSFEIGVILT